MVVRVNQLPRLPRRAEDSHKGTFGTVALVCGSASMLGAAILAARGALRGGAGLVRACLPPDLMPAFMAAVPSATTTARRGESGTWLAGVHALVVGPGLSTTDAARTLVHELIGAPVVPMVLDADGLNVLSPLSDRVPGRAILTPHPGEAGRLLGCSTRDVQRNREQSALDLAERSGQVVALKGAHTIVTDGDHVFVNDSGNPGMATGGSGDVLAGVLGALLAQRLEPFDAACLGVHVHGLAGDLVAERLSQCGLTAEDLPRAIGEVMRP